MGMKRAILIAIGLACAIVVLANQPAHANRSCGLAFWQVGQTCETKDGRTCLFQSDNTFRCTKRPKARTAIRDNASGPSSAIKARKVGGRIIFDISRYAVAGSRTRISFITNIAPDCSPIQMRTRIALKPSRGAVETESSHGFPSYPKDNPRSKCNSTRVSGVAVYYTPAQDFSGTDTLEVAAISENGTMGVYKFTVTVQPEPTQTRPAPSAPSTNDEGVVVERLPITDKRAIFVKARINDVEGEFIVDTGATNVSVSHEFATLAKLRFDSSQSSTFNTANGAVQKHIGVADTVKLGGLVASGVRVAVSQRGAPDYVPGRAVGLLGMSFLSLFDVHISESELRLSSRPKGVPASAKADRLDQRPQVVAPSEPPAAVAAREWQDVKGSNSRAVLEAFRKRHEKDPVYSALADEAMRKLAPETLAVPVPVPARRATRDPALSVNAGSGASFRDCPECPEMVVVPAGSFMMGSPGSEARYVIEGRNERPQRHVTIAKPFAVGKFEVTFSEWEACVADFGCQGNRWPSDEGWSKGRRPVINVSWNDAKEYIAWLSRKTGQTYRLLTEAEWEYAARAGTTTRYSWGDEFSSSSANNNKGRTVPVGGYPANPWGLYDVHGNAWEWVEDCYGNYIGAPTDGTAAGGGRVLLPRSSRRLLVQRPTGLAFRVSQ